jgi:hypothetical protein
MTSRCRHMCRGTSKPTIVLVVAALDPFVRFPLLHLHPFAPLDRLKQDPRYEFLFLVLHILGDSFFVDTVDRQRHLHDPSATWSGSSMSTHRHYMTIDLVSSKISPDLDPSDGTPNRRRRCSCTRVRVTSTPTPILPYRLSLPACPYLRRIVWPPRCSHTSSLTPHVSMYTSHLIFHRPLSARF